MIKHNQDGTVSGVGISLIICVILLIASVSFAAWAFLGRQDYKNNVDQKIDTAVTVAKQQEGSAKEKEFTEREKFPLRTYAGPEAYGSLTLQFPKTWSGAVDDTGKTSGFVNGYFYPNTVPSLSDQNSTFALRMQVVNTPYAQVIQSLASLQQNKTRPFTISPYAFPKVPSIVGVKLSGYLPNQKTGIMVVIPLRASTLQLWTEGDRFTNDYNNTILPNFSFSP